MPEKKTGTTLHNMFVHINPQLNSNKVKIADLLMKFLDIMIITEYDFP